MQFEVMEAFRAIRASSEMTEIILVHLFLLLLDGDGCSSTCLIEPGYVWTGDPSVWSKCGNGVVDDTEQWDDGNLINGDGWSIFWQIETGYTCKGNPSNWSIWGDSKIGGIEQWDDGNLINGDGCSSLWQIEQSSVVSVWGNGKIEQGEECDDSNLINGDGWSNMWQIEVGYTCKGSLSNWSIWGDSTLGGTEQWDDGNLINGDGCSSLWKIEQSQQVSVWGNGKIEQDEECDDANLINGDGCNSFCFVEDYYSCTGTPSVCSVQIEIQPIDKAMGITFQASLGAGISLQTIIASFAGQSLIGVWVMVNSLQLLRYLSLFSIYLPKNIFIFLSYINIVNFDNQNLQKFYQIHISSDALNHKNVTNYRYINQGIESSSILLNWGDTFVVIIWSITYYIVISFIVILFSYLKKNRTKIDASIKAKHKTSRYLKIFSNPFPTLFFKAIFLIY